LLRTRSQFVLLVLLAQFVAPSRMPAQATSPASVPKASPPQVLPEQLDDPRAPAALLRSVKVILDPGQPAVQIDATRPMVPSMKVFESPRRLVIDLNKSYVSESKWIRVHSPQLSGMRVSQFKTNPPVVRIVLDLLKPAGYSWKADGNRLTVRLGPPGQSQQPEVAKVPAPEPEQAKPALIAPVPGTTGAVMQAGSQTTGGSSVYAGVETAIVHLPRGGEVRVCPGTTVSVTYSQNGRDLMLGMSTGALEVHYALTDSIDAVVTPDFRIMLPGPGQFDYAFSADSRGNTCVRGLPGNRAPVVVAELMGDGVYDVKPSQEVTFHSGHLTSIAATAPPDCGCPEPGAMVMRAANEPPPPAPPPAAAEQQPASAPQIAANVPETAPLPAAKPNDVQVQVEAPFVFKGDQAPPPAAKTEKAETIDVPMVYAPQPQTTEVVAQPSTPPQKPAKTAPSPHRGFMGKLKGFFSSIFH
jgi:AMIN domain